MSAWVVSQRLDSKLNKTSLRFALDELVKAGFATRADFGEQGGSPLSVLVTLEGVPQQRLYADIANEGFIESLLAKFGSVQKTQSNPKSRRNPLTVPGIRPLAGWPEDVYDPRLESVRAVARGTDGLWGVAVGKYAQSRPPSDVIQRSYERYFIEPVDELIRKRQAYEKMLSDNRRGTPFRVTAEPTSEGMRYFVWPLGPGVRTPTPYRTRKEAELALKQLLAIGVWPALGLPRETYTRTELKNWLPPENLFDERSGLLTRALHDKMRKEVVKKENSALTAAPDLLALYRRVSPEWYKDAELIDAFKRGELPPKK